VARSRLVFRREGGRGGADPLVGSDRLKSYAVVVNSSGQL